MEKGVSFQNKHTYFKLQLDALPSLMNWTISSNTG